MNKSFPDELLLRDLGTLNGTQVFEILQDFRYNSKKFGMIVAHKGFQTTGASIPRVFWSIMSPVGSYFFSSLIHDVLYVQNCYGFSRKEADEIFLEAMTEQKVPFLTRMTIFYTVRAFGWKFYMK